MNGVAVMALLPDDTGALWVATYDGGLNRLDPKTGRFSHYVHDPADAGSLSDNRVLALCRDRDGVLWVGTFEGGLDRLDPTTGKFTHLRHRPGDPGSLSSDGIRCLYEDRRGNLWVGTAHGLNVLDRRTGRFTRFHHDPKDSRSLSGDAIRCVYEDGSGTLWVGTTDGGINAFRYPDGRVTRYTRKDGLPGDGIFGILGDDRGNLWISTNNGLARFNPREGRFKVYQEADGLQGNAFSFGGYHRGRGGKLYFGGSKGLSAFYPDSVQDDRFVPPVVITNIEVQDRPRPELLAAVPSGWSPTRIRSRSSLPRWASTRPKTSSTPTGWRAWTGIGCTPTAAATCGTPASTGAPTCSGSLPPTATGCGTGPGCACPCTLRRPCGSDAPSGRSSCCCSAWACGACTGCGSGR
jgi:streptogramin lyase